MAHSSAVGAASLAGTRTRAAEGAADVLQVLRPSVAHVFEDLFPLWAAVPHEDVAQPVGSTGFVLHHLCLRAGADGGPRHVRPQLANGERLRNWQRRVLRRHLRFQQLHRVQIARVKACNVNVDLHVLERLRRER